MVGMGDGMGVLGRTMAVVLAVVASTAMAQGAAQEAARSTDLAVSGYDGKVQVIYRNGHAYVEIEGLARVTQSSLAFQGKNIVLTLPAATIQVTQAAPASTPPAPAAPQEKGFSRDFLRAGVEQMTVVREWRSAVENAVRTGNPVDQSWVAGYRRNAENRMAMASAMATTESDKEALSLLQNVNGMIQQLSDRFLSLRSTLTYAPTDSLDNDPLDQKILACAQGMTAVAIPGGQFQDVQACH